MEHDKDYYRSIHVNGYFWGGFDVENQLHMFSRKVLQRWESVAGDENRYRLVRDDERGSWHGLWENCLVNEEDLKDGSAEWMMLNGFTRINRETNLGLRRISSSGRAVPL